MQIRQWRTPCGLSKRVDVNQSRNTRDGLLVICSTRHYQHPDLPVFALLAAVSMYKICRAFLVDVQALDGANGREVLRCNKPPPRNVRFMRPYAQSARRNNASDHLDIVNKMPPKTQDAMLTKQ
jgi:hypothetical protein